MVLLMASIEIKAGTKFGRWTVMREADRICGQRAALCRCECGVERPVIVYHLRAGRSQSCGCHKDDSKTTHGQARMTETTPEYRAWVEMRRRCRDTNHRGRRQYVQRGIRVCKEWDESFEAFFSHVGKRPSPEHSIDRINNDGNYEPGNVRWATRMEQQRNRRTMIVLTLNGVSRCAAEWATITGIAEATIRARKARGWNDERALTEPVL